MDRQLIAVAVAPVERLRPLRDLGGDRVVACGIATVGVVDPAVLVIAGGVSRLGSLLLGPVRRASRAEALLGARGVPIREAVLGERAGLVGAGLSALYVL